MNQGLKHRKVLVLNADYTPISIFPLHTISAQRAVTRIYNGTCYAVSEYDDYIPTKYHKVKYPSVIVRKDYLKRETKNFLIYAIRLKIRIYRMRMQ